MTLSDVAEAVGVSAQTVSRVLNNHPSVRPETRQKVLAAVQALGYEPNLAARLLASGSSGAVGILLTAGLSHGMASTFSAIARAVRERGDTFVLATAEGGARSPCDRHWPTCTVTAWRPSWSWPSAPTS